VTLLVTGPVVLVSTSAPYGTRSRGRFAGICIAAGIPTLTEADKRRVVGRPGRSRSRRCWGETTGRGSTRPDGFATSGTLTASCSSRWGGGPESSRAKEPRGLREHVEADLKKVRRLSRVKPGHHGHLTVTDRHRSRGGRRALCMEWWRSSPRHLPRGQGHFRKREWYHAVLHNGNCLTTSRSVSSGGTGGGVVQPRHIVQEPPPESL